MTVRGEFGDKLGTDKPGPADNDDLHNLSFALAGVTRPSSRLGVGIDSVLTGRGEATCPAGTPATDECCCYRVRHDRTRAGLTWSCRALGLASHHQSGNLGKCATPDAPDPGCETCRPSQWRLERSPRSHCGYGVSVVPHDLGATSVLCGDHLFRPRQGPLTSCPAPVDSRSRVGPWFARTSRGSGCSIEIAQS